MPRPFYEWKYMDLEWNHGYWKARSCQCSKLLVAAWADDRDMAWQHRQTTTDKQSLRFLQAGSSAGSAVTNQNRQGDDH